MSEAFHMSIYHRLKPEMHFETPEERSREWKETPEICYPGRHCVSGQVSQFRDLDEHFKHSIESDDNSYFKNNRHTLGLGSCLKTKDKNEIYSLK